MWTGPFLRRANSQTGRCHPAIREEFGPPSVGILGGGPRSTLSFFAIARSHEARSAVPTYDIEVTRDGRWWMIHLPRARRRHTSPFPGEIEDMARSYIAVTTGTPVMRSTSTGLVDIRPPSFGCRRRPDR